MGLFDSLKNMFAHHEHHHGASIGQSLTLADAKAILAGLSLFGVGEWVGGVVVPVG